MRGAPSSASAMRRPTWSDEASATATFRTPVDLVSGYAGRTVASPIKAGPSRVAIRNHLLRTLARNSRRITTQVRCTASRLPARRGARGVRPNQVDEHLVQRRLGTLEPGNPGSGFQGGGEEPLRIRSIGQLPFGVLAV